MTKIFIFLLLVILVAGGLFIFMTPAEAPVMEDDMPADSMQPQANVPQGNTNGSDSTAIEAAPTVVIDISGKNFEFSQKEIRVKQGDIVQINFTSESGFHDWAVDEFNARTEQVRDGGKTSVTFSADKKGAFEYYCSVGQHRANGMVGMLIVE